MVPPRKRSHHLGRPGGKKKTFERKAERYASRCPGKEKKRRRVPKKKTRRIKGFLCPNQNPPPKEEGSLPYSVKKKREKCLFTGEGLPPQVLGVVCLNLKAGALLERSTLLSRETRPALTRNEPSRQEKEKSESFRSVKKDAPPLSLNEGGRYPHPFIKQSPAAGGMKPHHPPFERE